MPRLSVLIPLLRKATCIRWAQEKLTARTGFMLNNYFHPFSRVHPQGDGWEWREKRQTRWRDGNYYAMLTLPPTRARKTAIEAMELDESYFMEEQKYQQSRSLSPFALLNKKQQRARDFFSQSSLPLCSFSSHLPSRRCRCCFCGGEEKKFFFLSIHGEFVSTNNCVAAVAAMWV